MLSAFKLKILIKGVNEHISTDSNGNPVHICCSRLRLPASWEAVSDYSEVARSFFPLSSNLKLPATPNALSPRAYYNMQTKLRHEGVGPEAPNCL